MLMLDRILEYQKAVTICYGQSEEVDLQVRNPSVTEWHAAQLYLIALWPSWKIVFSSGYRIVALFPILISSCVTLKRKHHKMLRGALPSAEVSSLELSNTSL